jgi:hypothetical protein
MSKKFGILISIIVLSVLVFTACAGLSYPFDAGGFVKFNVVKKNIGADITFKNTSGKDINLLSYNLLTYAENGIQLDSIDFSQSDLIAGDEMLQPTFFSDVVNYVIIEVISVNINGKKNVLNLMSQEFKMK